MKNKNLYSYFYFSIAGGCTLALLPILDDNTTTGGGIFCRYNEQKRWKNNVPKSFKGKVEHLNVVGKNPLRLQQTP